MIRKLGLILLFLLLIAASGLAAQDEIEQRTLVHDGQTRRYLLYVPPQAAEGAPLPLVFVLHGGGGNPENALNTLRFASKARDEGFILVMPAGTGRRGSERLLTWNSGYCCGYAYEAQVDDVGFFRALVDALTAELSVDSTRIYVAGHSNGAMMAYRLAAEMSDVFAAAASVAGTIGGYPTPDSADLYIIPQPAQPVSILHIHGMEDGNVPYAGGLNDRDALSRRNDLAVADAMAFWIQANGCPAEPTRETRDNAMVLIERYDCAGTQTGVTLIAIVDGGHSWPGGSGGRLRGDPPSTRLSATDEAWAFFAAHPKAGD